jgi:hypothetical protein
MNINDIKDESNAFFKWPYGKTKWVGYPEALLFAQHCVKKAVQADRERVRQIVTEELTETWFAACRQVNDAISKYEGKDEPLDSE